MKIYSICIISLACLLVACQSKTPMFQLIPADQSHIEFNNKIVENDMINPFDVTNMYNGAGLGIGTLTTMVCWIFILQETSRLRNYT